MIEPKAMNNDRWWRALNNRYAVITQAEMDEVLADALYHRTLCLAWARADCSARPVEQSDPVDTNNKTLSVAKIAT